jgi:hypothetical protein
MVDVRSHALKAPMKHSLPAITRRTSGIRGLCLAALVAATAPLSWAQVQSVEVSKDHQYIQTSTTTVAHDGGYAFNVDVDGVNIQAIAAPMISGPIDTASLGSFWHGGLMTYKPGDQGWRLGFPNGLSWGSPTLADLDSKFASGTYTVVVNGATIPLQLTGNAYPNPPLMTLSGGAWSNGKYVVDPAQPVTITTSAFAGYGTHVDDLICIVAFVPGFSVPFQNNAPFGCAFAQARQFASVVPGTNTLSYTIPANTLIAGGEYPVFAAFQAVVDKHPDPALTGSVNVALYGRTTRLTLKAQAPIFPMTVNANIGPVVSNASANIQYRPEDVGTTGSVYVFAVAPSTRVLNASFDKDAQVAAWPKGAKDASVQCVIAQLNSNGQLQAVSASSLQAYVTGVLSGQGQAVTLINNVLTANIGGIALYVGYGQNALDMLTRGLNRRAVTVPGTVACDPEAPQMGWWWNPAEGGRGYSIEVAGNHVFFASYLYDVSGRATWYVASGNTSLDGSLFTGNLEGYSQGQSLSSVYRAPTAAVLSGAITLAFNDASHGTMIWPGGSVPIERFNIVPNGLTLAAGTNQPEGGWWFNPSEGGRGFFLEWQGGELFMAGYMYDDNGNPIWYLSSNTVQSTNLQAYSNTWWQYANGQTLTGAFKPASQINNNVAPVTITFQGSENAIMTLPNSRTTALRRFRF